jgi:hypothetical protein
VTFFVRNFLCRLPFVVLLIASRVFGQSTPSADEWYKRWLNQSEKKGLYPHRITVISSLGATQPEFVEADEGEEFGFISPIPTEQFSMLFLLNQRPENISQVEVRQTLPMASWVEMLYQASNTDTVVYRDGKKWVYTHLIKGKPRILFRSEGTVFSSFAEFHEHFLELIGYDGVILDQQDSYYLVAAYRANLKGQSQALAVDNSAGRFKLPSRSTKGSALLELVDQGDQVAVFKTLLSNKKALRPGAKIIIEKSRN